MVSKSFLIPGYMGVTLTESQPGFVKSCSLLNEMMWAIQQAAPSDLKWVNHMGYSAPTHNPAPHPMDICTKLLLPIPTHPSLAPRTYGFEVHFFPVATQTRNMGMTTEKTLTCFSLDSCWLPKGVCIDGPHHEDILGVGFQISHQYSTFVTIHHNLSHRGTKTLLHLHDSRRPLCLQQVKSTRLHIWCKVTSMCRNLLKWWGWSLIPLKNGGEGTIFGKENFF